MAKGKINVHTENIFPIIKNSDNYGKNFFFKKRKG